MGTLVSTSFVPQYISYSSASFNSRLIELWTGLGEDWQAWTPTLGNVTLGTGGTNEAWRKGGGAKGQLHGRIVFGTGGGLTGGPTATVYNTGTQQWRGADMSAETATNHPMRAGLEALYYDSSAGRWYRGVVEIVTETMFFYQADGLGLPLSASVPFTWASGDMILYSGTYLRSAGNDVFE